MAAVPSIGRASLVEAPRVAPQAAATQGLYERHAAKIQSYCMHQLGSREEAEDAVQTTFMNAFRALGRGVVPEAESAWLFKIAENVCLSRRRSSWRRGRIESPSDFGVIEEIVPGPSRQRDELIGIEHALASMPEQQRRAILLREWQGLSYREIATELEVSQSAVETLIFRARRSLAQGLEQPDSVKPAKRKSFRRALHVIDLGTVVAALKTLLAGSVAVKATAAAVAVTAAVGTTATVSSTQSSRAPAKPPAPAVVSPEAAEPKPSVTAATVRVDESAAKPVATATRRSTPKEPVRAVVSRSASKRIAPAAAAPAPAAAPVEAATASAPAGERPSHETPKATEPGGRADEGKSHEGKGTEAPAEPQPVAAVPQETGRGGSSEGGNAKKDAPAQPAPAVVVVGPVAAAVDGPKKERGKGHDKRALASTAPVVDAEPAPIVVATESAPAVEPAAVADAQLAPDVEAGDKGSTDDGDGKRKHK